MSGYRRWQDIRAEHIARAGGEEAVRAAKEELLAETADRRLAAPRSARGVTRREGPTSLSDVSDDDTIAAELRPVVAVGGEDDDGGR